MKTEAKIKQLGWKVEIGKVIIMDRYWLRIVLNGCVIESPIPGDYDNSKLEEAAYNWIAKEFNLDNLVSKDKLIEWFYEHSDGIEEARIFDINDFTKWLKVNK